MALITKNVIVLLLLFLLPHFMFVFPSWPIKEAAEIICYPLSLALILVMSSFQSYILDRCWTLFNFYTHTQTGSLFGGRIAPFSRDYVKKRCVMCTVHVCSPPFYFFSKLFFLLLLLLFPKVMPNRSSLRLYLDADSIQFVVHPQVKIVVLCTSVVYSKGSLDLTFFF